MGLFPSGTRILFVFAGLTGCSITFPTVSDAPELDLSGEEEGQTQACLIDCGSQMQCVETPEGNFCVPTLSIPSVPDLEGENSSGDAGAEPDPGSPHAATCGEVLCAHGRCIETPAGAFCAPEAIFPPVSSDEESDDASEGNEGSDDSEPDGPKPTDPSSPASDEPSAGATRCDEVDCGEMRLCIETLGGAFCAPDLSHFPRPGSHADEGDEDDPQDEEDEDNAEGSDEDSEESRSCEDIRCLGAMRCVDTTHGPLCVPPLGTR